MASKPSGGNRSKQQTQQATNDQKGGAAAIGAAKTKPKGKKAKVKDRPDLLSFGQDDE